MSETGLQFGGMNESKVVITPWHGLPVVSVGRITLTLDRLGLNIFLTSTNREEFFFVSRFVGDGNMA